MAKKIIKMTPDQLGYKDRGKMKWQGLMLSDQLDALRKTKNEEKDLQPVAKKQMTEHELSSVLQQAYFNKWPIVIQANVMRNGHYFPDLKCMVLGYADNKIYLQLKDGRRTSSELSQLRNISFMNPAEWYEKS